MPAAMTRFIDTHHAAVTLANDVATLTLTNAKSMNILGTPAILEMTAALEALRARDDVRVLVLRGSGDKAFITRLKNLCEAVRSFPAPVIARLSGWTLGGGLEVALAADLRLSSIAALAARLAGLGPAVMRQQKQLLRSWQSLPPDAAIEATVAEFGRAFATGEPQRYMGTFKNRKR